MDQFISTRERIVAFYGARYVPRSVSPEDNLSNVSLSAFLNEKFGSYLTEDQIVIRRRTNTPSSGNE